MIAVVDYGVGNLFSLKSSLGYLGLDSVVTGDAETIRRADRIILPGVGAFREAYEKLTATGLVPLLLEQVRSGKPLLGICLGMQLLFEKSYEYGECEGLGLLKGAICPLADDVKGLKVPQIGWNSLDIKRESPILKYTENGAYVYYVHSYYAKYCDGSVIATGEYGVDVPGIVGKGNVYGTQFHPEKSGSVGLGILKAFSEI